MSQTDDALLMSHAAMREALERLVRTVDDTGGISRGDGAPLGECSWVALGDAYVAACVALDRPVLVAADTAWCRECGQDILIDAAGVANHRDDDKPDRIDRDADAHHAPVPEIWERLEDGSIPKIQWSTDVQAQDQGRAEEGQAEA